MSNDTKATRLSGMTETVNYYFSMVIRTQKPLNSKQKDHVSDILNQLEEYGQEASIIKTSAKLLIAY